MINVQIVRKLEFGWVEENMETVARSGERLEIASTILFIASPANEYLYGSILIQADGALSANPSTY